MKLGKREKEIYIQYLRLQIEFHEYTIERALLFPKVLKKFLNKEKTILKILKLLYREAFYEDRKTDTGDS